MEKAIGLIYSSYRDDAKLTKDFLKIVRAALQDCDMDELAALCSPTSGLASLHSFPPGLYEIATFRKARRESSAKEYTGRAHNLHYFADDPKEPEIDRGTADERREFARRTVMEAFGHDPYVPEAERHKTRNMPLDPAIKAKIDDGTWSVADLKTKDSGLRSPQMRELAAWCKAHPTPDTKAPEFADWHRAYVKRFDEIFISDRSVRGT